MARFLPVHWTIWCAIARAQPESSISLPKIAPSMNSGKNFARYVPSAGMNVWVYVASSGASPQLNSSATPAHTGAIMITLAPRYARKISRPRETTIPTIPTMAIPSFHFVLLLVTPSRRRRVQRIGIPPSHWQYWWFGRTRQPPARH